MLRKIKLFLKKLFKTQRYVLNKKKIKASLGNSINAYAHEIIRLNEKLKVVKEQKTGVKMGKVKFILESFKKQIAAECVSEKRKSHYTGVAFGVRLVKDVIFCNQIYEY